MESCENYMGVEKKDSFSLKTETFQSEISFTFVRKIPVEFSANNQGPPRGFRGPGGIETDKALIFGV